MTSLCIASVSLCSGALPIVRRRFSRRFAHLDLGAHLLDFRRLFFECCSESCHTLFQFPHFPLLLEESLMLFEKLVEQHRVHCFIADGVEVPLSVMGHQVGVHLRHLLGYQAELWDARLIQLGLVMEGDGTQGQERLTGSGHVGDVPLESARGEKDPQLTLVIHVTGGATRADRLPRDTPDVAAVAHVRTTYPTDTDNIIGGGDAVAGARAYCDVATASCDVGEASIPDGRVVYAGGVAPERADAIGRVLKAGGVAAERCIADSGV